jgi:hypothetical protein
MIGIRRDGLKAEAAIECDRPFELRQRVELDLAIAEAGGFRESGADERPAEPGTARLWTYVKALQFARALIERA